MQRFYAFILILVFILPIYTFAQDELTLNQSLQYAMEHSSVMLKTRAEIMAAEGSAGQVVAAFLPQLSLSGSMGKYYSVPINVEMTMAGSTSVFSYGTDEQADTTSWSGSLSQPIFAGGMIWNSIGMANKGVEVARQEFRRIHQQVSFDVINAYYNVIKASRFVDLNKESVEMAKTHLNQVETLLRVGMATRAEVLRIEVQLAQAEMVLTKAKQGLEISRNHFNNTLGRDLDVPVLLEETNSDLLEDIIIYDYKDLLAVAYENRPDWKQYVLAEGVSEDEVRIAYSGLLPTISFVGNYENGSTRYPSYTNDTRSWTAMLSGSWNVFDGTATFNRIKEARAKLEAGRADETSVRMAIALEVKDASFLLKSAKENVTSAEKALALANENYKIAKLRYKSGIGTNVEAIDAQVALTQGRIDYLQAEHELKIAKARINKVVGGEIY